MKIAELEITEPEKKLLTLMVRAMTPAECAAFLDCSLTNAYNKLSVWLAKTWVRKVKLVRKKIAYALREDVLEV